MKITDLEKIKKTKEISYVLGLVYPLMKVKEIDNTRFLIGAINYNYGTDENEVNEHFKVVSNFLIYYLDANFLLANKNAYGSISSKMGFSICIDTEGKSDYQCREILQNLVDQIAISNDLEIKQYFLRGCFDGRSSFDTTAKYLALDIDRNSTIRKTIDKISKVFGFDFNFNIREPNHTKNDQVRIKPSQLNLFLDKIGLFSVRRKSQIELYLKSL